MALRRTTPARHDDLEQRLAAAPAIAVPAPQVLRHAGAEGARKGQETTHIPKAMPRGRTRIIIATAAAALALTGLLAARFSDLWR